jgi:SNF2 domain-containing protein
MSSALVELNTGQSVSHSEMGPGVFLSAVPGGYARVFFQQLGERQVAITSLAPALSWEEQIVSSVRPATREAIERLWLALEAEQLPLLENSATLTSAKVDLLPHQIVLTYRIANASPRRFLVADSVGLGKTIETALILRELASRGELTRALMVVPAGLVENWRRELNDTFQHRRHDQQPPSAERGRIPAHAGRRLRCAWRAAFFTAASPHARVPFVSAGKGVLRRLNGLSARWLQPGRGGGQPGPRAGLRDDDLPEDRR